MSNSVRVVVRYRKTNSYGLHAVLGALGVIRPPGDWTVGFAPDPGTLISALDDALTHHDRVLVLWSCYSPEFPALVSELAALRAVTDDVRVTHLLGGVHATAQPRQCLAAGFDVVAVGEGEATLPAVVAALVGDGDLTAVPGLAALDGAGALVSTGPAPRLPLDAAPSFATDWGRYGPIEITRGCIYACRFCQTPYMFKARFRHRSIDSVREHVERLRHEGMRYVRFITPSALSYGTDDTEPNLAAVDELLATSRDAIGPGGKVYFGSFPSEARPEHITAEALAVLRRWVDNTTIIVGAQSGSDAVLAHTKRGHGTDVVERAVALCLEAGFRPDVDFVFGLPGETDDDARASLALASRLVERGARIHNHVFMPLPGTPFADEPPGTVAPEVALELERIAARGALYGQWRAQRETAVAIAPLARRTRR